MGLGRLHVAARLTVPPAIDAPNACDGGARCVQDAVVPPHGAAGRLPLPGSPQDAVLAPLLGLGLAVGLQVVALACQDAGAAGPCGGIGEGLPARLYPQQGA